MALPHISSLAVRVKNAHGIRPFILKNEDQPIGANAVVPMANGFSQGRSPVQQLSPKIFHQNKIISDPRGTSKKLPNRPLTTLVPTSARGSVPPRRTPRLSRQIIWPRPKPTFLTGIRTLWSAQGLL